MNIPTVIFWDPTFWEIRESAKPFFEKLKKVGVFHENPSSAAKHINLIWENVEKWWQSKEVINAVNDFNFLYNKKGVNIAKALEKEIIEEIV